MFAPTVHAFSCAMCAFSRRKSSFSPTMCTFPRSKCAFSTAMCANAATKSSFPAARCFLGKVGTPIRSRTPRLTARAGWGSPGLQRRLNSDTNRLRVRLTTGWVSARKGRRPGRTSNERAPPIHAGDVPARIRRYVPLWRGSSAHRRVSAARTHVRRARSTSAIRVISCLFVVKQSGPKRIPARWGHPADTGGRDWKLEHGWVD